MITSANLLESEIYEIQEVWTRWKDHRYAYHALRSSPQGSSIFLPCVPPLESLKVMGLKGIHHCNAPCCHAGLWYCPWCGKVGQNEGTVVNHLWTTHYKLGLICSRCLHFPLTTSKAIWHHGQNCKHSDTKEEDGRPSDDDSSMSDWFTPSCPLHLQCLQYQLYIYVKLLSQKIKILKHYKLSMFIFLTPTLDNLKCYTDIHVHFHATSNYDNDIYMQR